MHKLIMVAGILSMVTLAGAGAALIWFTQDQPEDSGFVRDYLLHLEPAEREQLRVFLAAAAERGEITDRALRDYLLDAELRARIERLGGPSEALLLDVIGAEDSHTRLQEQQAIIDRLAARAQSYDNVRAKVDEERAEAQRTRQAAETLLREWSERTTNERLNQIVSDLDRTREPEDMLPQLQFLPLSDLYYVLTTTRNGENRAAVFAALPEPTQRGLALIGTNPASLPRD